MERRISFEKKVNSFYTMADNWYIVCPEILWEAKLKVDGLV
jgi:hypothetical protein